MPKVVEKVIASDELMTKFRIPKHTSFVRQSADTATVAPIHVSIWRGTARVNPQALKTTPIRQPRCKKLRFPVDLAGRSAQCGNLPEGSDQFNSLQEN